MSEEDRGARARLREFLDAPRLPIDIGALAWTELFPGVRIHVLERVDGAPKRALLAIDAETEVPAHTHDVSEDLLLLEGSLELIGDGDGIYSPGQVFRSKQGTTHSVRNSGRDPCLCYVVYSPPGA